jgi:hypothetical protein
LRIDQDKGARGELLALLERVLTQQIAVSRIVVSGGVLSGESKLKCIASNYAPDPVSMAMRMYTQVAGRKSSMMARAVYTGGQTKVPARV